MPRVQKDPSGGSNFQTAYPCLSCPDFAMVKFSRSKFRNMCGRSGVWLDSCGVIRCPLRREGGNHDDAAESLTYARLGSCLVRVFSFLRFPLPVKQRFDRNPKGCCYPTQSG